MGVTSVYHSARPNWGDRRTARRQLLHGDRTEAEKLAPRPEAFVDEKRRAFRRPAPHRRPKDMRTRYLWGGLALGDGTEVEVGAATLVRGFALRGGDRRIGKREMKELVLLGLR